MILSPIRARQLCNSYTAFLLVCLSLVLHASTAYAVDVLQDGRFSRGVHLFPFHPVAADDARFMARAAYPDTCLPVTDCSQQPVWSLQQWSTAQDIGTTTMLSLANGDQQWRLLDSAGRVQKRLRLSVSNARPALLLEMNGLSEFAARTEDGVPQYLPDLRHPWPHFLLSQDLPRERLSGYQALPLSIRFRVPMDEPQRATGYDSGIHAARLVLAITVRNRLSGNYFWLTLPLYDDRALHVSTEAVSGFGCQKCTHDGEQCYTPVALSDAGRWRCPEDRVGDQWWQNPKPGTARMIFRMPAQRFVRNDIDGWQRADGDLLPYVQAGVEAVRERHNGKSFPKDLFFYELGRFTLGWEMTGFNRAAVEIDSMQLKGIVKPGLLQSGLSDE